MADKKVPRKRKAVLARYEPKPNVTRTIVRHGATGDEIADERIRQIRASKAADEAAEKKSS